MENISAALAAAGLEYMSSHFLPMHKPWSIYSQTCSMQSKGQVVLSNNDYLLGMDRRMYQNMSFWYAHHNTDHYLVLGCLRGAPAQEHMYYLGRKF